MSVLKKLEAICDEIFERWDKDQRSGKLLSALGGRLPRYRDDVTEVRNALASPSTDMAAAKKIEGDVLAYYPVLRLDDDGNLTDEVIEGGAWCVTQYVGNSWNEPDLLNATGEYFGDDGEYSPEPTHWLPCPPRISKAEAQAAITPVKAQPEPAPA